MLHRKELTIEMFLFSLNSVTFQCVLVRFVRFNIKYEAPPLCILRFLFCVASDVLNKK